MTDADTNACRIQLLLTDRIADDTWIPVGVNSGGQTVWIKAIQFKPTMHTTRFMLELGEPLGLQYYEHFTRHYRRKPTPT